VGSSDTDYNYGGDPGISATLPTGIEAGDEIILTVTAGSPETPDGYTLVSSSNDGESYDPTVTVYAKTATDHETDAYVTTGYEGGAVSVAVYRGVNTTTPIDQVSDATGSGDSVTAAPVTASVPGERFVLAEAAGNSDWTAPEGWTQEASNNSGPVFSGLADSPTQPLAGGSISPTATLASSANTAGVLFGLEPAASTSTTTTYAYDSIGDRTSSTVGTASPSTYGYNQIGQMVSSTPVGGSAYTYAYNGDGLRMSTTVSSTTESFTYDPLSTALLVDGSTYYVYGAGGLPLEQITGSTPLYYLHDQLGSTRVVADGRGTAVDTYTYDPYGNLLGSTGSDANPFGFAGDYTDAETGFLYLASLLHAFPARKVVRYVKVPVL
jgi:YD repeat-containing protein